MRLLYWLFPCLLLLCGCAQSPHIGSDSWNAIKIAYSPDGKFLAVAQPQAISIYDASNNSLLGVLPSECRYFDDFVWMSDGRIVTVQSSPFFECNVTNYTIIFWDAKRMLPLHTLVLDIDRESETPPTLASSPLGHVAFSYAHYNRAAENYFYGVHVIDGATYDFLKNMTTSANTKVSYSPDGKYLQLGGAGCNFECGPEYDFYSTKDYAVVPISVPRSVKQLTWSRDAKSMAGISGASLERNMTLFSVRQGNGSFELVPIGAYRIAAGNSVGKQTTINDIKFSPDSRYVALGGSYSVSACPDIPEICSMGFVEIFDMQSKEVVFWDDGGKTIDNFGRFDWLSNGKLAYLFGDDGPEELRIISPADFT